MGMVATMRCRRIRGRTIRRQDSLMPDRGRGMGQTAEALLCPDGEIPSIPVNTGVSVTLARALHDGLGFVGWLRQVLGYRDPTLESVKSI